MRLVDLIFGRKPSPLKPTLALFEPPPAELWRKARPKEGAPPVCAQLAASDGEVATRRGTLTFRTGEHYIVKRDGADRSVVRRDVFERTYVRRPDGKYEKRPDVSYRYVVLKAPALVLTLEGPQPASTGDWVIEGVAGEHWPVSRKKAHMLYATL